MMRKLFLLAAIGILLFTIVQTLKQPAEVTETSLQQEIQEIQAKLPIRIDAYTELNKVELQASTISYSFLVTQDPTQAESLNTNDEGFSQQVESAVKNNACKNKTTKRYLDSNVTLVYRYTDADNNSIASFEIPAGYCN